MSSVKQKPRRLVFRERIVFRTTSETLRLSEPDILLNNNNNNNSLGVVKKKGNSGSFQVTSVSHGPSGGADSAEDESHSHSDDISRITDIETPSYSEDTFSKDTEDVAIEEKQQPSNCFIEEREDADSVVKLETLSAPPQQDKFIGRFQVVKVESLAPFKRGRWVCHDYLDNSKHAPKDGYVFYNGRYLSSKEYKEIQPTPPNNVNLNDNANAASYPAVLYICTCLPNSHHISSTIPTFTLQGHSASSTSTSTSTISQQILPQSLSVQQFYHTQQPVYYNPNFQHHQQQQIPNAVSMGQIFPQDLLINMQNNEVVIQSLNPNLYITSETTNTNSNSTATVGSGSGSANNVIGTSASISIRLCDCDVQMATAQRPVLGPNSMELASNSLPKISDLTDTTLLAVYVFIKNFIGVSSCTSAAIDSKIEQAMDLVRSNLMNKLRAEVIVLQQNLADLNARIEQLETENEFLRKNVSPQTIIALETLLAQKQDKQNQQQIIAIANNEKI